VQRRTVEIPEVFDFLFDPAARYKVCYSGRGAAKSWSFARALIIQSSRKPLRVLCAREYQSSIRDSVHRLLSDQIDVMGLSSVFDAGKAEISGKNGSLFIFEGIKHNVTKIKSMEGIDIVWCEEAERISEESWRVLIPTIRKKGSEIWVSFNPDQETDPTYKRFVIDHPNGAIVREVSWEDNPWFPEELRREMEYDYRTDPDAAAWVWGGQCRTITDAQVLKGKWVVQEFAPASEWNGPYFGADWGFAKDPTVLIKLWVHNHKLWIEYEAYGIGVDIADTPTLFDAIPESRRYVIRADNARPETINHVRKAGFRIIGADKWKGSIEDGISFLRSFEQIIIHPRCKHIAQEARLWSYKTDKLTGDVLPKLQEGHEHCWDASRYALQPMITRSSSGKIASAGRRQFS
jgi:phage terminase large subunit